MERKKIEATEEQLAYAKTLDIGMKVGLSTLLITFFIYVTGIFEPHIPLSELPKYWALPVDRYLAETKLGAGWSWLAQIGKGDSLNFLGIAFLAGLTIIAYLTLIPILIKKKDKVYLFLAVIEVMVLLLAASGVLSG